MAARSDPPGRVCTDGGEGMDEQDTPPRGYRVPREYRKGSRYAEQQPPPSPSPVGPPPSAGGAGPVGWIRRWPIAALGAVAVLALALGAVVGVAARQGAVDEQKDRADRVQHELETVAGDRDTMRRRAEDAEGEVVDLHDQVKKLSARGEVPSFVGDFVDDVESSDAVEAYNWKVKTKSQISEKEPGTVLSQSRKEGTTLKAGRSITLVVAKKAPPKPKQWVTIKTFS